MKKERENHRPDRKWLVRAGLVAVFDAIFIIVAYMLGLWGRFDFKFSTININIRQYILFVLIVTAESLIIYNVFQLYNTVWRYAGVYEVAQAVKAYLVIGILELIERSILRWEVPRISMLFGFTLSFLCCVGIRLFYRMYRRELHEFQQVRTGEKKHATRVMIVGAGGAGHQLAHEFQISSYLSGEVVCFIDDNPNVYGKKLDGIPIVGNRYDIPNAVKDYQIDMICLAIPSAPQKERVAILNICKDTGCRIKILPGIYQLVKGEVSVSRLRDVEITDLLGRKEIKVNNDEIFHVLHGRRIMVTGGGGSIGSELCRQIAGAAPDLLIIFDIYENNAYDIQQELKQNMPNVHVIALIGSVRDKARVRDVIRTYRPDVIFHAAAHKHVPLMEDSPNEAIKNNVLGTWNTAEAAAEFGVKTFLLISTDKAVNPTNVMGATKRICEMIIQAMDRRHPDTKYVAVRFGNVLGSNGSVVPLFKKQIASGGPVTVTDPNIIRYFMTIPEAVSLILQASYYAKGGEIFVLDMGDPVKIDDMARNMIRLSGHTPDGDIKIVYTGLRPGEKLYEELLMDEEGMRKTQNNRIYIGHPIQFDDQKFHQQIHELIQAAWKNTPDIRPMIEAIVPTYHPNEAQNVPDKEKGTKSSKKVC